MNDLFYPQDEWVSEENVFFRILAPIRVYSTLILGTLILELHILELHILELHILELHILELHILCSPSIQLHSIVAIKNKL